MNIEHKKTLKKILTYSLLICILALLAFAAVLNTMRPSVAAIASGEFDPDAMSALDSCRASCAVVDFDTRLVGKIRAKVFGVPYVQNVYGSRSVRGEDFCDHIESVSAVVKAAIRKSSDGGKFSVEHGEYKKKKFVYSEPVDMERDDYIAEYGMPPIGLVKYDLDDTVIKSERVGDNAFRFVLDASRATEYSRNEVRTTLGGSEYPVYDSVEFTLYTDGERALRVVACEKFRIKKFGGTYCTAEYTEDFFYAA